MTRNLRAGKIGKGTTSVVPLSATKNAALAAEGLAPSRFMPSRFTS